MADRIVLNTISYHGHGAIENIVPELTARGYKKAFVCSDPDLIKFGVTKKVTDLLDAANFAYAVYSEIKPNPTIANVQDGVAAFKAAEADCIVTIGGGSSMDTAKAIGIIINNPEFADVCCACKYGLWQRDSGGVSAGAADLVCGGDPAHQARRIQALIPLGGDTIESATDLPAGRQCVCSGASPAQWTGARLQILCGCRR